MRTYISYVVALAKTFIIAPVLRLIQPSLDRIVADFLKLDTKLDAFLDREADRRVKLLDQRKALRAQIDTIMDEVTASYEAAERAGRIQRRVKDIIE